MLHRLADINNLTDPLKQFESRFIIAVPPKSPFTADTADKIELRAQTFGFPTITGDETTVMWGGHERKYAGKQTRGGDWSVTFTEVWDGEIIDGFKKWLNNYHDFVSGKISLFEDYKTTIKVILLDPDVYQDSSGKSEKSLTLYRAWPKNISVPDINASSSDPVNITVQLRYDYFIMGSEEEEAHSSN